MLTARRPWLAAGIVLVAALGAGLAIAASPSPAPAVSTPPTIRHVFVIVLENENEGTSFGAGAASPYLAQTLPSMGLFLPNYYGIGHASLDNYIAMISGQAPDAQTQADCGLYEEFAPKAPPLVENEQAEGHGCVYPSSVPDITEQLTSAGFTWKGYMQSMPKACSHPLVGKADEEKGEGAHDTYATRHDPFVYFQGITENGGFGAYCDAHVVNLSALPADLSSASTTPNYSFITPDVCSDGHDAVCAEAGRPAGYAGINEFLSTWVPQITSSPAFQESGLLVVTFDESANDSSACCGEKPGPNSAVPGGSGPGGGKVGAVLVSPFIPGGTTSTTAYNHYSLLASIEGLFGLSQIGMAGAPGLPTFGPDVYNATVPPKTTTTSPPTTTTTPTTTTPTTTTSPGNKGGPPSTYLCTSTHQLTIKLPSGKQRLSHVTVLVAGKKAHVHQGKHPTAVITLRGLPKGTALVTITARLHGKKYRAKRHVHTC